MARRNSFYTVSPRFTPGSPAQVDEATAQHVVHQERNSHQHALEGRHGDAIADLAKRLGLAGIVEHWYEAGGGWIIEDQLTGARFFRLQQLRVCKRELRKGDNVFINGYAAQEVKDLRRADTTDHRRTTQPMDEIHMLGGQVFTVRDVQHVQVVR